MSSRSIHNFLVVGLTMAVVYLWFFRKPEQVVVYNTQVVAEGPVRRLSAFVDSNMDKVFAPLSPKETIIPAQELRQIRASLLDMQASAAVQKDRELYATGVVICDLLLKGITEREEHARRLADSVSKGYSSPLSKAETREQDAERRRAFFEGNIQRSWERAYTIIAGEVNRQYSYMRLLER